MELGCPTLHAVAPMHSPPPAPPGSGAPAQEPPKAVPTPDDLAPDIGDPAPDPVLPIREPGAGELPQATCGAGWLH